jgi:hypothetical protein
MTLEAQSLLIDGLILENPDATIKDYLRVIGRVKNRMVSLLVFESTMNVMEKQKRKPGKDARKYYQSFHINR